MNRRLLQIAIAGGIAAGAIVLVLFLGTFGEGPSVPPPKPSPPAADLAPPAAPPPAPEEARAAAAEPEEPSPPAAKPAKPRPAAAEPEEPSPPAAEPEEPSPPAAEPAKPRPAAAAPEVAALTPPTGPRPRLLGPRETAPPLALDLPIRCQPGVSCWIVNYVDVDAGKGRSDYRCGWLSYDDHKGTDIAIRDLAAMRRGVTVLAAAAGLVVGVRDAMPDVNVRQIGGRAALKGKDCGNGVLVRGAAGWEFQYCHMRRGSVAVKKGDRVAAGQRLGLVGMSGAAELPHVHFQIKYKGAIVDPFVGLEGGAGCSLGARPLWKPEVVARLGYRSVHVYNAGFSTAEPEVEAVRGGAYRGKTIAGDAPALFLWVEVVWPRPGDTVSFRIQDPDGKTILDHRLSVKRFRARQVYSARSRREARRWKKGKYRGEVRLIREKGPAGREGYATRLTVTVR